MKRKIRYLAFVLAFLTIPGLVFSQWTHSFDSNKPLIKVYTLDSFHAFAVGSNGVLLRTANGGYSWEQIQTNTTNKLFDVKFIDSSTGFICGENGTLLKSIDGGNTWNPCATNTTLHLRSICFVNSNIGWISGSSGNSPIQLPADSGVILKTTNGGNSFTVSQSVDAGVQKVTAYNQDTCLAICNGYTGNGSFILKTTNSGVTWLTSYVAGCNPLTAIEVFPSGLAYVSCYYFYLFKTTDFGASWDSTSFPLPQEAMDLSFPSPLIGYTAGFDPMAMEGYVFNTTDGGQNWIPQLYDHYFCSVDFCNDSVGYAIADNGTIFKHGIIDGIVPEPKPIIPHIQIYPDPVTYSINIVINENPSNGILRYPLVVEIYSALGEKLLEKQFSGAPFIINDLEQLSPGMYNILIRDRSSFLSAKKIIKKE
jgi:photosystem II stability/assembly factor-like uncharacterized protein